MYIEGYLPNQEELIQATTQTVRLATLKDNIKACFKNGLPLELIAKGFGLQLDEVKMLLDEN